MRWVITAISVTWLCLILSCDSEKDQYGGLSDMVEQRQEARKSISKETARKKELENFWEDKKSNLENSSARGTEPISPDVVYEKQIEILDSESKLPLAKGVAYMNKKGQIIKIKVYQ